MSFDQLAAAAAATVFAQLGAPATVRPAAGAARSVRAILDRPREAIGLDRGAVVELQPTVRLLAGDGLLRKGDIIEIAGRRWQVIGAAELSEDGLEQTAPVRDEGPAS